MEMFEIAVRNKYRFPFKGSVSVEDLWDLSMSDLDKVYKALNAQKKETEEDSLMISNGTENNEVLTKIAIVRYIYNEKVAEKARKEKAIENREKRQRIMEILANKKDAALQNATEEELVKMLAELN